MRKKIFIIFLIIHSTLGLNAQNNVLNKSTVKANETSKSKGPKAEIKIETKNVSNKIYLKWSPTDFNSLKHGLKNGFNVFRTEYKSNTPFVKINSSTVKPISKAQIEAKKDTSNANKITALAVTSISFNEKAPSQIGLAVQKMKNEEMNFAIIVSGMALYNQTAQDLGLYFEDSNIEAGKQYIYKIECTQPYNGKPLLGSVYVNSANTYELPKITDTKVIFTDKNVTLGWRRDYVTINYAYFDIYRSENENNGYVKLNDKPFVSAYSNTDRMKDFSFFADSVPTYDKKYFYKIIGIGPFGDVSEPVVVSGIALKLLKVKPVLEKPVAKNSQEIKLKWSYDSKETKEIKEVIVEKATNVEGPFQSLQKLEISDKEFTDNKIIKNAYYRIKLLGNAGDSTFSKTQFYHIVDSIAPAVPLGLKGYIDTNFVAHITWNKNKEEDMFGYRVFRAQHKKDFMLRLTKGSISDTSYNDTISKNSTLKYIYYTVASLDETGNTSVLSLPLELRKPDKIKPQTPEITKYQLIEGGVFIRFNPSASFDLQRQELLRKGPTDNDFQVIKTFFKSDSVFSYTDTTLQNGYKYSYCVRAYDETGLVSLPGKIITINATDLGHKPKISEFKVLVNRPTQQIKVSWKYDYVVKQFKIYRAKNDEQMLLYKVIDAKEREFFDTKMTINTKYKYAIKAIFEDYGESALSETVEILY